MSNYRKLYGPMANLIITVAIGAGWIGPGDLDAGTVATLIGLAAGVVGTVWGATNTPPEEK